MRRPATDPPLVLLINGPNLNLLGRREPEVYGTATLAQVVAECADHAAALGLSLDARQSNHEGQLIDWLHEAQDRGARAVILNPGGYTHTSVALRDAVAAIVVPVWEVHLTEPRRREPFRQVGYLDGVVAGRIAGQGPRGYRLALDAIAAR